MENAELINICDPAWWKKVLYGKCIFFLLLFQPFSPIDAFSQTYPYKFHSLTVDEGLSHTDANDVIQDKQGYIWIATFFGLSRYDGFSIKRFYNSNAPLSNSFKNRIRCITSDADGNIWIGTEDGLQRFNVRSEKYTDFQVPGRKSPPLYEKLYKPYGDLLYGLLDGQLKIYAIQGDSIREQPLENPPTVWFSDFVADSNGRFFLSGDKGLWALDQHKNFKKIGIIGLPGERLATLHIDARNNLMVANENMLYLLGPCPPSQGNIPLIPILRRFSTPAKSFIKVILDNNIVEYWVNTSSEIYRLDRDFKIIQIITGNNSPHSLNSGSMTKMLIDRSQCLWVCTFGGGINYCDLNEKLFYTVQHNPDASNSLSENNIRSVLAEGDNIWLGTTSTGLNLYNLKTEAFTQFSTHSSPVKLKANTITALALDNDGNLWIGSNSGIEILRPDRKGLWVAPGCDKFPGYAIETLARDCYGNMWFGNHMDKCGVVYKDRQQQFHVKYYDISYFILADSNRPQVFMSSIHGLKRAIIDAEGNITEIFTYKAGSEGKSLSSNYTYPIRKQNDSTWWIGTIGGGLNRLTLPADPDSFHIKSYGSEVGIFKDVESLEIDNEGNVWMGGNGLECLNTTTGKLVRYDKNDGLQGNSFKVGSSFKGADGRLYFGGINGLNYFYPARIKANGIDARPVLTDILVNNQRPTYGNTDSSKNTIAQAIGYGSALKLNYLQNNFVISFSSMHFANPLKCRYRYKLLGFDKAWQFTDGKYPGAAYSNLDYDHYTFIVEASNNDGIWSKSRAEMDVFITPPWWKSTLAKICYILLILLGLSGIYFYQARWHRLERELELRAVNERKMQELHKQREELHKQQLTFFTNISHEFRTPLSLILGPLETMMSQNKNSGLDNFYQLMHRNAKRLINLINELMNFKKVADSVIKLQVQSLAIAPFCRDLTAEFHDLAAGKDISFTMKDHMENLSQPPAKGFFDVQVLEKILFNLLNNSFKYTNIGGRVTFEIFTDLASFTPSFTHGFQLLNQVYRAEKYLYFRIADSGIGISEESLKNIFDRYYRVSKNHLGSGVGLALVKSLTQLHKGDIYVYSEHYKGTEIIIGIPWREEDYDLSERIAGNTTPETQLEVLDTSTLLPFVEHDHDNDLAALPFKMGKHILIVDDNQELRVFLRQAFEKQHHIYEAEDGYSGLELAIEKVPDLIISDVMMPGMNGIEFCKLVKERFETSHIPFIILSAKDALDTKLEGMEVGADFYFSKPLSIDLLLLTVHNIFEQNKKLKLKYTNDYLSQATDLVNSEKDKDFLHHLVELIDQHIHDPALDAEFLCERLFISRTKLYQKIKSISDQTVAEFIRTIRLKKAVQIMTHEDIAMNDVADRIGMLSASNFSRAFKKEYGKSPLQFLHSLKNNNS